MIKKILIICLIFTALIGSVIWFYFGRKEPVKHVNFYITKLYGSDLLCFSEDDCHYVEPHSEIVNNRNLVRFSEDHYYDLSTYKYNKLTDTYRVNLIYDRDPYDEFGFYSKCPYDEGNISHIIFSIKYIPSKQVFKAEYIGFMSSKNIIDEQKGSIKKFLNMYFTKDANFIPELNDYLKYFNEEAIQTFNSPHGFEYDIEITYLIKKYLSSKS